MHLNKISKISRLVIMLLIFSFILTGCGRGRTSGKEPIHPNPNMDSQPKYKAQAASRFFEDGAAMRPLVEGAVARGQLKEDIEYYTGKDSKGEFILSAPVEITRKRLKRGRERYGIFCAPCHSLLGDGRGIMISKGYVPPPNFHSDRIRQFSDGQIFDVIRNGVRNMPSYKHQIPTDDIWSIILYFRVLQRSQNAAIEDIPVEIIEDLKK